MSGHIRIRMYRVGFGDCFVVMFPGDGRTHTVLIDCGKHQGTANDPDRPDFWDVVAKMQADIESVMNGKSIDVVVATHRHQDHVLGFGKPDLWKDFTVGEVWMPWTENPDDPAAVKIRTKQTLAAERAFHAIRAIRGADATANDMSGVAENSRPNEAAWNTLLRGFLGNPTVRFLPGSDPTVPTILPTPGTFVLPGDVRVHVLGPSRDRDVMKELDPPAGEGYLRMSPTDSESIGTVPQLWGKRWDVPVDGYEHRCSRIGTPFPAIPKNFTTSVRDAALAGPEGLAFDVDKAVNATSLVLAFEVKGTVLLFPGDAQWGTWKAILANPDWQDLLRRVQVIKIGHHGSHNATPRDFVNQHLQAADVALVPVAKTSYTKKGWTEIPKKELMAALHDDTKISAVLRSDETQEVGGVVTLNDKYCVEVTVPILPVP